MKEKMIHSLWLMPNGSIFNKFQKIINNLAEKYNAPKFEPHVTLIASVTDEDVFEKTEILSKKIKPFNLKIVKASYMFDYYRCVIALAEKSPEIMNAAKKARGLFINYNIREYLPHLSLLYGDFPEKIKKEIVKKLGDISAEFKVKEINLVTGGDVPEEWNVVKRFKLG